MPSFIGCTLSHQFSSPCQYAQIEKRIISLPYTALDDVKRRSAIWESCINGTRGHTNNHPIVLSIATLGTTCQVLKHCSTIKNMATPKVGRRNGIPCQHRPVPAEICRHNDLFYQAKATSFQIKLHILLTA